MKWLLLISMLFLGGCEAFAMQIYANTVEDYADTRSLVRNYIADNAADRRWVRSQCRFALQAKVAALQAAGQSEAAYILLKKHYPPVVTQELLDKGLASLNTPWICGKGTD